jgi:hypothetical protein
MVLQPNALTGEVERRLQVMVRAEGPTRLLSVVDQKVHLPLVPSSNATASEEDLGWEPWSGGTTEAVMALVPQQPASSPPRPSLLSEVHLVSRVLSHMHERGNVCRFPVLHSWAGEQQLELGVFES